MVGAVALTAVVAVPLSRQPGHRPQPRDRCHHGAGVDLALTLQVLRFIKKTFRPGDDDSLYLSCFPIF
jgi:hypothetical protein